MPAGVRQAVVERAGIAILAVLVRAALDLVATTEEGLTGMEGVGISVLTVLVPLAARWGVSLAHVPARIAGRRVGVPGSRVRTDPDWVTSEKENESEGRGASLQGVQRASER
jgi:hypothetical protein